jgi:hypothetical protein
MKREVEIGMVRNELAAAISVYEMQNRKVDELRRKLTLLLAEFHEGDRVWFRDRGRDFPAVVTNLAWQDYRNEPVRYFVKLVTKSGHLENRRDRIVFSSLRPREELIPGEVVMKWNGTELVPDEPGGPDGRHHQDAG